jgi:hypothetical protein
VVLQIEHRKLLSSQVTLLNLYRSEKGSQLACHYYLLRSFTDLLSFQCPTSSGDLLTGCTLIVTIASASFDKHRDSNTAAQIPALELWLKLILRMSKTLRNSRV